MSLTFPQDVMLSLRQGGAISPGVHQAFHEWVHRAIVVFDLVPGIQRICKNAFVGFPAYQTRIMLEAFRVDPTTSVILGGREVGKTFPLAVAFLLRGIIQSGYELFIVPGTKIDQAKVPLKYIQIMVTQSRVLKSRSGANTALSHLAWTTLSRELENGSAWRAIAPNEGLLGDHGSLWCDEYQDLDGTVDQALEGFDNRPGDRRVVSGTAQVRGSPLHQAYRRAMKHSPDHVVSIPVQHALDAGFLSRAHVMAKKRENGGKLSQVMFDAWFNCVFPALGTMGWHPLPTDLTYDWCDSHTQDVVSYATGCDPGLPINRFVTAVRLRDGHCHCIREFELGDQELAAWGRLGRGALWVEHGRAFGGGYNAPFHSLLDLQGVSHVDSYVDGWWSQGEVRMRDVLFGDAFSLQNSDKLHVNPETCPVLMTACEVQTFDERGEMDRLDDTHWIFAMMHALRGVSTVQPGVSRGQAPAVWV
ncbi:MAG: hypothetical protein SXV54_24305 [Chloroflexota bacterium]|nr:hypothetical protein [Chloroflexota bacterium]